MVYECVFGLSTQADCTVTQLDLTSFAINIDVVLGF